MSLFKYLTIALTCLQIGACDYVVNNKTFDSTFMFGVSTSAYQIEGAWDEDGKAPSIWDAYTHLNTTSIADQSTGDIACDSYHKYKEDVELLKQLKVDYYRFSLSWTRLLPNGGTYPSVNDLAVEYYKNLLKELKANNIEPVVTLYHWDLPQIFQERGGFLQGGDSEYLVQWFSEYARFCFEQFGDSVKYWITFNEPKQVCYGGYGQGVKAPGLRYEGIDDYKCGHNLIKAHAAVWHMYDEEFREEQGGKVSISLDTSWYEAASNSSEDRVAVETKLAFEFGWFAHPIFLGDYPEVMKTRIANRSAAQGYSESRLPEFTEDEIESIRGTYDFLGLNHYTTSMIKAIPEPEIEMPPARQNDIGVQEYFDGEWETTSLGWLKVVPWGIKKLLKYIKETLNDPEIMITENGVCDEGTLEDDQRISFFTNYISYVRDAIEEDEVKVFAYTAWSLMDNFEWGDGYTQKFGFFHVDFESDNRTRTPKKSAAFYQKLAETHCLVDECD